MNRLPGRFVYPVVLVMILDLVFTLVGQPASYWTNFSRVNEGSPLGVGLLGANPLYFLIFFILYLFLMLILVHRLPLVLGGTLALSLFLGHSWGSGTWVYPIVTKLGFVLGNFSDWYLMVGYFVIISLASVLLTTGKYR